MNKEAGLVAKGDGRDGLALGLADADQYMRADKQDLTAEQGNCIQYPKTNHNEKEYKKNVCVCVCVKELLKKRSQIGSTFGLTPGEENFICDGLRALWVCETSRVTPVSLTMAMTN